MSLTKQNYVLSPTKWAVATHDYLPINSTKYKPTKPSPLFFFLVKIKSIFITSVPHSF